MNKRAALWAAIAIPLALTSGAKAQKFTSTTPAMYITVQQGQTQSFQATVGNLTGTSLLTHWEEAQWEVDGSRKAIQTLSGLTASTSFSWTFSIAGNHTVTARARYVDMGVSHWVTPVSWGVTVEPSSFTVTIQAAAGGSVTPSPAIYTYNKGSSVSIQATAAPCYQFVRWNYTGVTLANASSPGTNMTVNANGTLSAVFEKIRYTVTMEAPTGGTVSPGAGNYTWDCGTSHSISANPATGYKFVRWDHSFGLSVANTAAPSTDVLVNDSGTLRAQFELKKVTVPYVIGKTESQAEAAITAVEGLSVGRIIWTENNSVPAGQVVGQNPAGGA